MSLETLVVPMAEKSFHERRLQSDSRDGGMERRQFGNSHEALSPEARDLATAIDGYKLRHRRRFITYEEMLAVIKGLGYNLEPSSRRPSGNGESGHRKDWMERTAI